METVFCFDTSIYPLRMPLTLPLPHLWHPRPASSPPQCPPRRRSQRRTQSCWRWRPPRRRNGYRDGCCRSTAMLVERVLFGWHSGKTFKNRSDPGVSVCWLQSLLSHTSSLQEHVKISFIFIWNSPDRIWDSDPRRFRLRRRTPVGRSWPGGQGGSARCRRPGGGGKEIYIMRENKRYERKFLKRQEKRRRQHHKQ